MEKANIERINALAALAKQRPLTEEEAQERHNLRQAYLEAFRKQMRAQIENTVVEYPDGSRTPLRDAAKKK
jgi:Uncharacterized protein conserved in bacteria